MDRSCNSVLGQPTLRQSWPLFLALCFFRIANTFVIQSYFDPDEFWQTMEPAYCQIFVEEPHCKGLTWEWTRRAPENIVSIDIADFKGLIQSSMLGPARTYLSVLPVYFMFSILQRWGIDTYWAVSRGPMILYAVTVAAPVDFAIWYAARWLPLSSKYHSLPAWCLFCSLTSWFNAFSMVRTFANGQETLVLAVAVALVSPELLGNRQYRTNSFIRSCTAFFLGGLGVSIRFTAVAAFVPIGILLALVQQSSLGKIAYLVMPCAIFGLAGVMTAMIVDYYFFGFWTIPFLANFHFNVILDYADLYGSHPWHWYCTVGLPAISGLLLPFVVIGLYRTLRKIDLDVAQQRLWVISCSYLLIMSFNAHKEFRYILPILPLLCLLAAPSVRLFFVGSGSSPNRLRLIFIGLAWCSLNLIAVLYLGLFHQSGAISVNRAIVAHVKTTSAIDRPLRIHYLTGGCHTTPLLSHLHSPPLQFDVWHLNCSPQCRSVPDVMCETEQFARDPVGFVERAYYPCGVDIDERQCLANDQTLEVIAPPDYVVTFSAYATQIVDPLSSLGLHVVARFPHSINGAKIRDMVFGPSNREGVFGTRNIFDLMTVSVDEIVLFARYG